MTGLRELLVRSPRISIPTMAALNRLESAANRVQDRWPDVVTVAEKDREALVQLMRGRLEAGRWHGTKMSTATKAARVLFEADFRDRPDLANLLHFYLEETAVSTNATFLSAMMAVYIATYEPAAPHTIRLADALEKAQNNISNRWQMLFEAVPGILDPEAAPRAIAKLMMDMDDPWERLRALGLRAPHAPGLMDHVHLAYLERLSPHLDKRTTMDMLLGWLKPKGKEARSSGATEALEALLRPWQQQQPSADLQTHLIEGMVAMYGDPRIRRGFPWGSVDQGLMAIMMRWLTGENIRFFLDVVSAVESSHMWAPRRKFWLGLYERKLIDQAWVAFSRDAALKARSMRTSSDQRSLAYGIQEAGGGDSNKSLLILKIGNCIVVEGSHNFKVHVFRGSNPRAPKLFEPRYDCQTIRDLPGAETTRHHGRWEQRVMEHIEYLS